MDTSHAVVGVVGLAVIGDAPNALVNGEDPLDVGVGGRLGPVGGVADEVGRLQQAPERVGLVARVLGHAGHGVGVEHLEEERAEAADEH
jgi:hypothetical protein